ncbi:MAG TPA: hypothetical protein DDZ53_09095 [Firmicutes bacterium]|nr:hypothetical protein [Bacillota bacterium]
MRVAIAEFFHETCTFCPDPTTIELLEPHVRRGQAILDHLTGGYMHGYKQALDEVQAELVPLLEAGGAPGPYTSWLDTACFDKYTDEIVAGLREAGEVDGVLLSLHGAMAVQGVPKPEAEIVRRVRQAVGDKPIIVTLDLHANEDAELTDVADAVFVIKTYPHLDTEQTGYAAARCLIDTIQGRFQPRQALRKPGIISASIYQATDYPPVRTLLERCREWEKQDKVRWVAVAPGFAYADVPDVGLSVIAVTNGDQALADKIAQDVSDLAWSLRESFCQPLPNPQEAVAEALALIRQGQRPVVLADGADRTGDSTHMLQELLNQGVKNFAIPGIADPVVAKQLEATAQVGDKVKVSVGGWASEFSGAPVEISGVIEFMGRPKYTLVGPMGKGRQVQDGLVIRLNLGYNNHVVISERMRGANDSAGFTAVDIDVDSLDVVVLKDRVHHRAFWDTVAKADIKVDAPGIGAADLSTLHYDNVPDDIYPIGRKWHKEEVR